MKTINTSAPILVTGATGYVAGWIVKRLLEEGHTVHAAVRQPDKKEKVQFLLDIAAAAPGTLRLFKADLLNKGSYAEAMAGCELVYHTASPYTITVKNPQKELIEPAVEGTRNVLEQANQTESVQRVVLTSSCAAIYSDAAECAHYPGGMLTEEVWNTTASLDYQPYSYSKTLAEQEAWKIAGAQHRWDLVVLNPPAVFGPFLNPGATTSESFSLIKQMGDGTLRMGVPNIGIGVVDVRDLAEAHYRAGFTPQAQGRHIVSGHNSSFLEMASLLQERYGKHYPIGNTPLPKWLLLLVGPMINKAMSRTFIKNNVNHAWKANTDKVKKDLGMQFRPLRETLEDSFQVLIDNKMV